MNNDRWGVLTEPGWDHWLLSIHSLFCARDWDWCYVSLRCDDLHYDGVFVKKLVSLTPFHPSHPFHPCTHQIIILKMRRSQLLTRHGEIKTFTLYGYIRGAVLECPSICIQYSIHDIHLLYIIHTIHMCFVYAKQILPENGDCVMTDVRVVRSMSIFFCTNQINIRYCGFFLLLFHNLWWIYSFIAAVCFINRVIIVGWQGSTKFAKQKSYEIQLIYLLYQQSFYCMSLLLWYMNEYEQKLLSLCICCVSTYYMFLCVFRSPFEYFNMEH